MKKSIMSVLILSLVLTMVFSSVPVQTQSQQLPATALSQINGGLPAGCWYAMGSYAVSTTLVVAACFGPIGWALAGIAALAIEAGGIAFACSS